MDLVVRILSKLPLEFIEHLVHCVDENSKDTATGVVCDMSGKSLETLQCQNNCKDGAQAACGKGSVCIAATSNGFWHLGSRSMAHA